MLHCDRSLKCLKLPLMNRQLLLYAFFRLPPLTWSCISYMLGIMAYGLSGSITATAAVCCFFALSVIFYSTQSPHNSQYLSTALSIPVFFFLGSLISWHQHYWYTATAQLVNGTHEQLTGTIIDISPIDHPRFGQVVALSPTSDGCATNATCAIYSAGRPKFCVGDTIAIKKIKLQQPKSGGFERYCIKEGICATGCTNLQKAILLHRPLFSISRFFSSLKLNIFNRLRSKISPAGFTFFSSFFLGNRKINKKENDLLKKWCRYWGISHYLARSGLHLIIFIMAWEYLLRSIPVGFILKQFFLLTLTLIYCLLSWTSISFVRALLTLFFFRISTIFATHQNSLAGITVVTLIILLHNPWQLFFLDFQLSFGITYLLACITHYQKLMGKHQHTKP